MATAVVPVDLTNPGQVFACIGFAEAADVLLGEARGTFDWRASDSVKFRLAASGDEDPVARVLRFLDEASVTSLAPPGSENRTEKWEIITVMGGSCAFPFPDPESPAKLPARLTDGDERVIDIDYWGDATRGRDNVKFWAGAGGYPGAALHAMRSIWCADALLVAPKIHSLSMPSRAAAFVSIGVATTCR